MKESQRVVLFSGPEKTPAEITGPLGGNFEAEERGHNGK